MAIRIVRPVRVWRMGQYEQIDIEFLLPRQGEALITMEFVPSDEGMPLPFIEEIEGGEEDADGSNG